MTPLPKRKHSQKRQGKRRAAIKLPLPTLVVCPNCGQLTYPHTVCPSCGQYKKRVVVAKNEKRD